MADEKPSHEESDPEEYRMTLGDHLEELRGRLIKGIGGLIVAAVVCLALGERVVVFFCQPLIDGLRSHHLPAQLYTRKITDSFTVYMNVSLITALAMASPWIVYQVWQFIASGLYKHERKTVTKYLPVSILLMVSGMVFLYTVVLPITVKFLIGFTVGFWTPGQTAGKVQPTTQQVMTIPSIAGDPEKPVEKQFWYNSVKQELKFYDRGSTWVVRLESEGMFNPLIELNDYVDLVLILLVLFGLAFQMPLVVLAVAKVGLVEIDTLRKGRRIAYFAMAIVSAVIVPDVVTGMLALMFPLILLYELGIWMAKRSMEKSAVEGA
jgi:sec-independent protein translocase protein TatC